MHVRERAGAQRLLNAERHALATLRDATERHTDHLVAQLAKETKASESARARAARMAARMAAPALMVSLTEAIAHSREVARAVAKDDLSDHIHPRALHEAHDAGTDHLRAYAAAAGLAAAWGSLALQGITRARYGTPRRPGGRPTTVTAEIAAMTERFDARLRRTAATEVVQSFNETRGHVMVAHAEIAEAKAAERALPPGTSGAGRGRVLPFKAPGPAVVERHVKVWSVLLDGKLCQQCFAMRGTVVYVRDEFPGGDPPRHPWCRCIPIFLLVPVNMPLEELGAAYALAA